MKAKRGYSGLESFSLSFSPNRPELLKLSGNDTKMHLVNDLFNAGEDEEARKLLRQALDEVARNLDRIMDDRGITRDADDRLEPNAVASLLGQEI